MGGPNGRLSWWGFLGPALLLGQLGIGELHVDAAVDVDALRLVVGSPFDGFPFAFRVRRSLMAAVVPRRRR